MAKCEKVPISFVEVPLHGHKPALSIKIVHKAFIAILVVISTLLFDTKEIKPFKYYSFPGISNYHTVERIGEYFIIGTETELFYASVDN